MSQERIAGTYDLVASTFDRVGPGFFSRSGCRLVKWVQIPGRVDVLDVATGRGAILFPLAEWVGEQGWVVGVDVSGGMTRELAADARRADLRQVVIGQMNAERLGFADGSFDVVLCGHALFYFPQATSEFHRVLRPGGQVGVSVVAKGCLDWVFEVLGRYLPEESSESEDEGEEEETQAINTVDGLREVLSRAGFEGVRVVEEEMDVVYADEEEWWSALGTLGVRWALERIEAGALGRLREEMFERLQAFKQPDGVHVLYRVLYALGKKALDPSVRLCRTA
jgi:ubiquinone/menaquinone biosynthesis C-methylase UbiE